MLSTETGWKLITSYAAYRQQVEGLFGQKPEPIRVDTPFLDARREAERQAFWDACKGQIPMGPRCDLP